MHAYFIYAEFNEVANFDDIENYLAKKVIDKEMPGNIWLININTLKDLFNLIQADNKGLQLLLKKENFDLYGKLQDFKKRFSDLTVAEIENLSILWTQKSFPPDTNTFDICGYLFEARNYIKNSKDKDHDLFVAIVKENKL